MKYLLDQTDMQQIPLTQIPAQSFKVILADQYCTISIRWRQERLYLDLEVGQSVICRGAICQNRADIVQSRSQNFAGTLHFIDLEGNRPPHWQGLHTGTSGRWALVYVGADEEAPQTLRF
ncbi:MAG: hypothetical protein LBJ14_03915 [Desulfarculales bacterium]|jgi:hypothetical protein|nr:hypothetical protein [Desulfarculales bacterium]